MCAWDKPPVSKQVIGVYAAKISYISSDVYSLQKVNKNQSFQYSIFSR